MNRTGPPDLAGVQHLDLHPIMAERPVPRLRTQRAVAGVLVPAATVALLVIALRSPVHRGGTGLTAVTAAVIACWALAAVTCAWSSRRASGWTAAAAALLAAATLAAGRLAASSAGTPHTTGHTVARAAATVGVPLVIAAALHLVLAFPDGRLAGRPRQVTAAAAYLIAAVAGLSLAVAGHPFPAAAAAIGASVAALVALPALRLRYLRSGGHDREALQWAGLGAVTAADIALVAAVLHLLVAWPGPAGLVAVGATVAIPLGAMAAIAPALARQASRIFVYVLSAAGFSVVVAVIYLIVILGFGQAPDSSADREVLGLSMLAAAIAAIGYLPARDRLAAAATRFVYGARQAPDEVLRTFGSRLTRNVTMDELLLQLAESLRKTMGLTSAEVYTGSSDVLERTVSVPDSGPRSLVLTAREREVVSRAGVSGNAWTAIWLPALLDGRLRAQLRVAPVSHGGELLGLIVVERPADADSFTEDDDRVLTELARQTGLAFHNVQLDAALHTTLDELRKQAEELRASRARIVASGDAERRRVERNLHDGAQQHLVALAINLRLAKDIVAEDPDGTARDPRPAGHRRAGHDQGASRAGPRHLPAAPGRPGARRGAAGRGRPEPAGGRGVRGRRRGPLLGRPGSGRLLLLPGGPAERGQARARGHRPAPGVDRGRRPELRGQRRRSRFRRGQGPRRPRVRQHGRPARRHRRHRALGFRPRPGRHHQRIDPPALTGTVLAAVFIP